LLVWVIVGWKRGRTEAVIAKTQRDRETVIDFFRRNDWKYASIAMFVRGALIITAPDAHEWIRLRMPNLEGW